MLKFVFWSLLCINGALLAYSQGMLGHVTDNEREPARLKHEINADKLVLVAAFVPVPAKPAEPLACVEVGNVTLLEAPRFEARLAPLALGDRQSRQNVAAAGPANHVVYIAPQGSKEAAERKARELKEMGVTNYFIISDDSPMKWAISLGVFKSEAAAQALLAKLTSKGVHSARLSVRGATVSKVAYQFRTIDAATKQKIDDIAGTFTALETRSCK